MKPILFNTEMTKALLDGKKTVTRRVIKPQLAENVVEIHNVNPIGHLMFKTSDRLLDGWNNRKALCSNGDVLWVRETWLKADDGYHYKADVKVPSISEDLRKEYGYKWRPSIHMPKEAARIFLKVTGVRVERLQDITEEQIVKEGLSPYDDRCQDENWRPSFYDPDSGGSPQLKQGYEILWNSTIQKQDLDTCGWDANPWVWMYEFERIEKGED